MHGSRRIAVHGTTGQRKSCSESIHNFSPGDVMKIRLASATVLAAAAMFAALPAANAAAVSAHSPMHAFFHNNSQKKIRFNLRNDTGSPLELKIGDKVETLKADQVLPLKLPVGTRVTANADNGRYHSGDVIVEVNDNMYSDSTISIGK
jgi:hypothetical protein